jgi:hypothetical protein
MCNTTKKIRVKISKDLSYTGKTRYKYAKIDSCIADIVVALEKSKIYMRGSCCGHGRTNGEILLEDGRILLIKPKLSIK